MEPVQIKREMQARYDNFGEKVVRGLEGVRDPTQLWHMVEGTRPALIYFRRRKIETALALGRFPAGSTIAEVGCATGDYTFLLARMGFRMVGVDLSPKSIDGAKEKASILELRDVSFMVSDAEALTELSENAVDGVVSFSTLRYVPDVEQALRAIRRVLKPNAAAVLDFPNRYCPWFTLLKNRFGVETHIHDHQYSTREIVTLMRQVGFQTVEARRILFTPYILPTALLPFFKNIDRIGERIPFLNRTAAIIMAKGIKP